MNQEDFTKLLDARLEKIRATLVAKRAEYAAPTDILHNFKKAGAMLRCHAVTACVAFLTKHLVSIFDIAREIDAGVIREDRERQVDEKIGDAQCYLVLLEAIIMEKKESK